MNAEDTIEALWNRYKSDRILRLLKSAPPVVVRVLLTAAMMGMLVFLVSTFSLPNPNMILIAGLVICSFLFGLPAAVASALAMLGYSVYFFSAGHDFVTFTPENFLKVMVTVIGMAIVATFVCILRESASRALRDASTLASLLMEDNVLLKEASTLDALTGLRNRFALRMDYPHYADQGERLYVLMLDLDDFKHINDTYGHERGDAVLKATGSVLLEAFGSNHVYRYGGDEFLAIVAGVQQSSFDEACALMCKKMNALTISEGAEPMHFSGGYVSGTPEDQSDLRLMIRHADDYLYRAKHLGKNQVFSAPFDRELAHQLENES